MENNLSKAIKFPVRYDEVIRGVIDSSDDHPMFCAIVAIVLEGMGHAFGHALAEMINGLDGRGNLIAEMQNIRAQALSKQGRHSGLTEGYIEATACIDVIDHLLKFAEASKPDRQVKSAEEIEEEEKPVLVGTLKKEFGYKSMQPVMEGTEVYEYQGYYQFDVTTKAGVVFQQRFYKDTLAPEINFLDDLRSTV